MDEKKYHTDDFGDEPEDERHENKIPHVIPQDNDDDDDEVEYHFDEAAAQVEAVEGDYSAEQIQILERFHFRARLAPLGLRSRRQFD